MDELSDDNLKKTFSKLREFESKQEGARWSAIEKAIGEGSSSPRVGYALSLIALLLFVFPSSVDDFANDVSSEHVANIPSETKKQSAENHTDSKTLSLKSAAEEESIQAQILKAEVDPAVEQQVGTSLLSNKGFARNENVLLTKTPVRLPVNVEITLPIQYKIQLTDHSADTTFSNQDETEERQKPTVGIAGVYQFGVVDPLTSDNNFLEKYSSTPGLGLRSEIVFPAAIGRRKLDLSVTYSFMYKKMSYSFAEYGTETVTHRNDDKQSFSHIVGAGISCPLRSQWNATAHVNFNFGNGAMNTHTGKTFFSLSMQKSISINRSEIYVGALGGLPLTGTFQYFKYYPLQIFVGYKIKR